MSCLLHLKSRIVRNLPVSPQETSQMKDWINGTNNIIQYLSPKLDDEVLPSLPNRDRNVNRNSYPVRSPWRLSLPENQKMRLSPSPVSVEVNFTSRNEVLIRIGFSKIKGRTLIAQQRPFRSQIHLERKLYPWWIQDMTPKPFPLLKTMIES